MKKILIFVLILSLAFTAACGAKGEDDQSKENSVPASSAVSSEDGSAEPSADGNGLYSEQLTKPVNMGGRTFTVMQRWFSYNAEHVDFEGEVIWHDEENASLSHINLEKRKALETVEKEYNCTVTGEISTDTPAVIRDFIQSDLLSGAPTVDFCFETNYYAAFVENGYLRDLNTLGISFDMPWWDKNATEDLSVAGKLYFAVGDINTYDNDTTSVLLFNKKLYEEKFGSADELYDAVRKGNWNFDALKEKVTGFGNDLDDDDYRTDDDLYGLITETDFLYSHIVGAGGKSITKDEDDCPVYALDNENVYSAYNAARELYTNADDVFVNDLYHSWDIDHIYTDKDIEMFKNGQGLFLATNLYYVPYISDMEDDFGIIPIPKHDGAQDRYYSTSSTFLFVPASSLSEGEKGKQLGTILDALGAYSKDYVTPAYYDKLLKRGGTYDEDSAEMLDIIFENRSFDLGSVFAYAWGNPVSLCVELREDFRSVAELQKAAIETAINESMAKIKANN